MLISRKGADPLLYVERLAYVAALREAIAGLECARVLQDVARQAVGWHGGPVRENGTQVG
jgi:hypothetical protein